MSGGSYGGSDRAAAAEFDGSKALSAGASRVCGGLELGAVDPMVTGGSDPRWAATGQNYAPNSLCPVSVFYP